ncbi:Rv1733c family protein [Streptomyces sp. NPDC054833]
MSAHGSPSASGPPRPHKGDAPHGTNPLRRTSDRFESWFGRVLMLVLVLGVPAAALGAGLTAYESSLRTVHAQVAERHEVAARVMSDVPGDDSVSRQPARIRWTEPNGITRTGATFVEPETPKGATVRVWVNRDGDITGAPMNAVTAKANGWFVGVMAALGVVAGVYAVRAALRLALNRRRYAQWDTEWDLVEPLWSARFRR